MGRTTAKTSVSIPLYVHYKCSKCGEINNCVHTVVETRSSTQKGVVLSNSTRKGLLEQSSERATAAMGRKLTKIFTEKESGKYEAAEFDCKCKRCGHKEPWSRMRYTLIDSIMGVLLPFSLLFSLASIYVGIWYAVVLTSWFLFKRLHTNRMNTLIQQLPKSALPIFSLTQGEVFSNENDDKEIEAVKNTQEVPVADSQILFVSNADEIRKFKELFDLGIITEEEYELKKKQLLGL